MIWLLSVGCGPPVSPPAPAVTLWFLDRDGDGFGGASFVREAVDAPEGYVAAYGDCDDTDRTIHPAAPEVCNARDDNCDGAVDETGDEIVYADEDGDGLGWWQDATLGCTGAGWVGNDWDCDDTVPYGSLDWRDGSDNDCDGSVDQMLGPTWADIAWGAALPTGFAHGDLDGDGGADLVVYLSNNDGDHVSVVDVTHAGSIDTSPTQITTYGTRIHSPTVVPDLDGDGIDDLILVSDDGLVESLILVDATTGTGHLSSRIRGTLASARHQPLGVVPGAACDCDGDGAPEVTVNLHARGETVLLDHFAEADRPWGDVLPNLPVVGLTGADPGLQASAPLAAADLDGDGRDDLISVTAGFVFPGQTAVRILPGTDPMDGSSFESDGTTISWPDAGGDVAVGDLDGDGFADVAIPGRGTVGVWRGSAGAPHTWTDTPDLEVVDLWDPEDPRTNPAEVEMADFDGDGRDDLILQREGGVVIFLGDPGLVGTVSAKDADLDVGFPELWGAPGWPRIHAVDLDADGRADLVVGTPTMVYVGLGRSR